VTEGSDGWELRQSADSGASKLCHWRVGVVGPGVNRGGEGEGAAVEDLWPALAGDEQAEGAERPPLAGEGKDVTGGVSALSVSVG
jgi:hypothetical protein